MTGSLQNNRPVGRIDSQGHVDPNTYLYNAFQGDYTGTNLIYKGIAKPGTSTSSPAWQICKLAYDGSDNLTSITWPIGSIGAPTNDFEFIWSNRAAYTYA